MLDNGEKFALPCAAHPVGIRTLGYRFAFQHDSRS